MQAGRAMLTLLSTITAALFIVTGLAGCSKTVPCSELQVQQTYKSGAVGIDMGLLLGLSLDNEEGTNYDPLNRKPDTYRTLWIYQRNGKLNYVEKQGSIITPYGDELWKIENNIFTMSEQNDMPISDPVTVFDKYWSYYIFANIVSHQADEPTKKLFNKESFERTFLHEEDGYMGQPYMCNIEWLQFCGNKHISFLNWYYETGGGTYEFDRNNIEAYEIKELMSFESRKNRTRLIDFLDQDSQQKLKGYEKEYNKTLTKEDLVELKQSLDIDNLALFRSDGKWRIKLPLYNTYEHQGNGSSKVYLKDYIDTDILLPETFTGHDTLSVNWNIIKKLFPAAKDAVSSPDKELLVIQTSADILLFSHPENGLEPSLVVPVSDREKIILNQWVTGKNVGKWTEIIDRL